MFKSYISIRITRRCSYPPPERGSEGGKVTTPPLSLSLSPPRAFSPRARHNVHVSKSSPSFDEETASEGEARVTNGGGGIHYAPLIPEKYKLIGVQTYK